jgi:hypothetical protein
LFLKEEQIIRMGLPPVRIEISTTISGVSFEECYAKRQVDVLDGVEVNLINLAHLKVNKKASGRYKEMKNLMTAHSFQCPSCGAPLIPRGQFDLK